MSRSESRPLIPTLQSAPLLGFASPAGILGKLLFDQRVFLGGKVLKTKGLN